VTRILTIIAFLFATPAWAETLHCSGKLTYKNWGIPFGSDAKTKVFAVKRNGSELYIDGAYCSSNGAVYRCHKSDGYGGDFFREFDRYSMRLTETKKIADNKKVTELFEADCSFAKPKF